MLYNSEVHGIGILCACMNLSLGKYSGLIFGKVATQEYVGAFVPLSKLRNGNQVSSCMARDDMRIIGRCA